MVKTCSLLFVLGTMFGGTSVAQTEADPGDVVSPEAIIQASYEAISRAPGDPFDWDRYRSLFLPQAQMIPNTELLGGQFRVLTVQEFIDWVDDWFAENVPIGGPTDRGFQEEEIAADLEVYGDVAQVFSTYQKRPWEETAVFGRGIQSFQLVRSDDRWWIANIVWDEESGAGPIPESYLP
jgi:hypothetical protein